MLFNLSVENVALIEKADVNFGEGFNVLTGETGAGKSILIGSLNMLLGERVGKDIIRNGEESAYVEGLFYVPEDVCALPEFSEFKPDEDGCLIISRRLFSDGKNICKIGGKTVTVSALREIGRLLINIHGQHDNQALLDSSSHISFLDAVIPEKDRKTFLEYNEVYIKLKETEKRLNELNIDESEKERRIDLLTYEIDEINNASLVPGEEEELKGIQKISKNIESIKKSCLKALDALYENGEGVCVYNLMSEAKNAMMSIEQLGCDTEGASDRISEMMYELEDIAAAVRKKADLTENENMSLEEVEERLDLIYKLKRKYGNSEEEILEYCKKAEEELSLITSSDERRKKLEQEIKAHTEKANELARKNHKIRALAAEKIEKEIEFELSELNMENARFSVSFEETELSKNGIDKIEFLLSANKGEPLKPLTKIVSGGELSRIMLALKNVLSDGDVAKTLIFDEIDSGISGRAAGKVGAKLREISEKKQVLCVTHLPQIASLSQNHFKISKTLKDAKTVTTIKSLGSEEKISEIAMMIGGDNVTETTLAQAAEMVK